MPRLSTLAAVVAISLASPFALADARNELFAVARLKADQIGLWQRERLGDGGIIMESPFLVREAERLFAMGGAPTPNRSGRSSGGFACTTAIPRSCF